MSARISRDEVAQVARLARLRLTDVELDSLTSQLDDILEHASDMAALDLTDVPATTHPIPLVNVLRDDVVTASLDRAEVLAAAPSAEDGMFRVPPVMGEVP